MQANVLGQSLLGLAILLVGTGAASAGSFSISPVRATLSAQQPVGTLTVQNSGDTEAVIQLEVLKWTQQDGKDIYEPTRDVLATPPIFTLSPKGQQTIRVGLRTAADVASERGYRLFLSEVPPPPTPGLQGLQLALHLSLPVFINPAVPVRPALQWQATPEAGGFRLRVSNSGTAHVQINHLQLAQVGGGELVNMALSDYVLPGQTRSWVFGPALASGSHLLLRAQTDAGTLQSEVAVP